MVVVPIILIVMVKVIIKTSAEFSAFVPSRNATVV